MKELIFKTVEKRQAQIKSRCLHVLGLYVDYRKKRMVNDSCAVNEVIGIRMKFVI